MIILILINNKSREQTYAYIKEQHFILKSAFEEQQQFEFEQKLAYLRSQEGNDSGLDGDGNGLVDIRQVDGVDDVLHS